jgi:hypothetical protein
MSMRRVLMQVVGILVIGTCVVCPILEMFDHWDHTAQTGKDTESTLMVVALSVGLMIPAAGIVALPSLRPVASGVSVVAVAPLSHCLFADVPVPVSEPPPPLRI